MGRQLTDTLPAARELFKRASSLLGYDLAKPVVMPKGTRIVGISHFDNSPNNAYNPDPAKEVRWGPQNCDEMSNAFIGLLFDVTTPADSVLKKSGVSNLKPVSGRPGPTLASLAPAR